MGLFDCVKDLWKKLFGEPCEEKKVLVPNQILKGKGCWVQKTSKDNPFIYSKVFNWYVTDASNMEEDFVKKLDRPLFMSFSGKMVDVLREKLNIYRNQIHGVIWDYEFGADEKTAYKDLIAAKKAVNAKGLLFGVVTSVSPEDSVKLNGVDYNLLELYADFFIPMLYAQWWDNDPERTKEILCISRNESNIPAVPVITLETTSTKKPIKFQYGDITKIYGNLSLPSLLVWNVKDLNEGFLNELKGIS